MYFPRFGRYCDDAKGGCLNTGNFCGVGPV